MNRKLDLIVAGSLAEDIIFGDSHFGGSAGNIALNTALFDIYVQVLSVSGSDPFSESYLKFLTNNGVSIDLITKSLDKLPQCFVVNSANRSSSKFWLDNGNTDAFSGLELNKKIINSIESTRAMHLTTIPSNLGHKIVDLVSETCIVGYEPGPMVMRDPVYFSEYLFKKADILFVNEEEYAAISKKFNPVQALVQEKSDKVIIKTLGDQGASRISRSETVKHPSEGSIKGEDLIDSNGAGDAFKSGFYAEYLRSNDIDKAIKVANTFGAQIVKQQGAIFGERALKVLGNITTLINQLLLFSLILF